MKLQTLTINIKDIIINYTDAMNEIIKDAVRDNDVIGVQNSCENLKNDIRNMMSCNATRLATVLRNMFDKGETALMLADKLQMLEDWYHQGENFVVIVLDTEDRLVAAFTPNQIQW